ncbi:lysozyme inhibitor LprI family protein [Pectobacterium brasiliense]|uniref:lysozyme inhibitor LprI family protein n=1 Tax=Pectobacterium brasiliense TaxID=180957 RepID=UPI0020BF0A48|nr:lysozyme inhibitor LprI family protein [Pectobacterium brasiliense]
MKKTLLIALLFAFTTATYASDDFGKALDDQLTTCTNKAENTLATNDCFNIGSKAWDSELNKQYKLLLADQSEEFKANLKNSQVAWIKYRDSYLEAMRSFYMQQDSTIWGIVMSDAKLRVTRDKAIELYKLRTSTDLER